MQRRSSQLKTQLMHLRKESLNNFMLVGIIFTVYSNPDLRDISAAL